jgi:hypothetical protein
MNVKRLTHADAVSIVPTVFCRVEVRTNVNRLISRSENDYIDWPEAQGCKSPKTFEFSRTCNLANRWQRSIANVHSQYAT